MTKALVKTYNITTEYRTQITTVLLATCLMLAFAYAVNVYQIVSHTVALQKIESQTAAIGTDVRNLDTQYLSLSGKITPDILQAHGFTQGQVSEYISRTTSLGRIALRGYEL